MNKIRRTLDTVLLDGMRDTRQRGLPGEAVLDFVLTVGEVIFGLTMVALVVAGCVWWYVQARTSMLIVCGILAFLGGLFALAWWASNPNR